jgi:hypothetical protein
LPSLDGDTAHTHAPPPRPPTHPHTEHRNAKAHPPNPTCCILQAVAIEPDTGASKYMYLGQLGGGDDSVAAFTEAIRIMVGQLVEIDGEGGAAAATEEDEDSEELRVTLVREISSAFCSIAEVYLTDLCDAEGAEEACLDCLERALQYVFASCSFCSCFRAGSHTKSTPRRICIRLSTRRSQVFLYVLQVQSRVSAGDADHGERLHVVAATG